MKEFQLKFITNKQTVRSLKLLSALQTRSDFTLKELATITNNSDRTTLTDIQRIKEYFANSIFLEATHNNGYRFDILSLEEYNTKKRALIEAEPLFKIIESIFYSECHTLNEWSELLYTTVSTLSKQITIIQHVLLDYNITLLKKPIDFSGNEINIRQFFHDFYYESDITPHTIFPSLAVQEISSTLIKDNFFTEYSYISFTDFNYIVFITLQRYLKNHTLNDLNSDAQFLKEYLVNHMNTVDLSTVGLMIYDYFNIQLPELEATYLYTQLITRRSLLSLESEKLFIDRFNLWDEPNRLAQTYVTAISVPPHERYRSIIFYESFFITLKIKQLFAPVLNQNLPDVTDYSKKMFASHFNITRKFIFDNLSEWCDLSEKQIEDISAELVLYTDSIRNFYWKKERNIAILLEGNRFITENIRSLFQRYLGKHYPLYFPDVTQLSIDYLKDNQIDLIITNYNEYLINLDYGIEIVLFELIPTKRDWKRLFQILTPTLMGKSKLF